MLNDISHAKLALAQTFHQNPEFKRMTLVDIATLHSEAKKVDNEDAFTHQLVEFSHQVNQLVDELKLQTCLISSQYETPKAEKDKAVREKAAKVAAQGLLSPSTRAMAAKSARLVDA